MKETDKRELIPIRVVSVEVGIIRPIETLTFAKCSQEWRLMLSFNRSTWVVKVRAFINQYCSKYVDMVYFVRPFSGAALKIDMQVFDNYF